MSWVKFHDELTQGAKRGLPRATRFVFLELCLLARKGRGVVQLPLGMRDVDAVCDLLGGERREIVRALATLTARASEADEPMVRFESTPSGRALVIAKWEKWNKVDDSAARVQRYRERRNGDGGEDVTRYSGVSNAPLPLPDSDREKEREKETAHTHRAGERERAHDGPAEAAPAQTEPVSPLAATLLGELRRHGSLASVATAEFASALEGRAMASGRRAEWLVAAIGKAAADTPPGEVEQAVRRRVRGYCDRASEADVRPPDRPAKPSLRAVQGGAALQRPDTSWHPPEGLEEAHRRRNAVLAATLGKDAPL